MARRLTTAPSTLVVERPCRQGRYDAWLNGSIWELGLGDFKGRFKKVRKASKIWTRARRALKGRARRRALVLHIHKLSDGTLTVQARRL